MKKRILLSLAALVAGSIVAADSSPKEIVTSAAKKLGDKTNYTWKAIVVVPEDMPFKPGPTEGKTEKDGYTLVSTSFFDNQTQAVFKGKKGVVTNQDGQWVALEDLEKEEGPGRFMAMQMRVLKVPAQEVVELISFAKELKQDGDVYVTELTEQGAKSLQSFGEMPGGGQINIKDAKGSAKFWIKEGLLSKYELKVKGTLEFGDNGFPNDRTTTVEIKDVGTTKLEIPEAAKKKLP